MGAGVGVETHSTHKKQKQYYIHETLNCPMSTNAAPPHQTQLIVSTSVPLNHPALSLQIMASDCPLEINCASQILLFSARRSPRLSPTSRQHLLAGDESGDEMGEGG